MQCKSCSVKSVSLEKRLFAVHRENRHPLVSLSSRYSHHEGFPSSFFQLLLSCFSHRNAKHALILSAVLAQQNKLCYHSEMLLFINVHSPCYKF